MNNINDVSQKQGQLPIKQGPGEKEKSPVDYKIAHLIKFLGLSDRDMEKYKNTQYDKDQLFDRAGECATGMGRPKNIRKAALLYKFAVLKGHEGAKHYLGHLYDVGAGVEKDRRKAFELYHMCAIQGNRSSAFLVSFLWEEFSGDDVAKSDQFLNISEKDQQN